MVTIEASLQSLHEQIDSRNDRPIGAPTQRGQPSSQQQTLFNRLVDHIRAPLEMPQSRTSEKHNAVRLFTRDMNRLKRLATEWYDFIVQLEELHCDSTNLQVLSKKNRGRLKKNSNTLFQRSRQLTIDEDRLLVDTLLAKPDSEVIEELQHQLELIVENLVSQVLNNLCLLKDRHILGTISWADNQHCHFEDWSHFFDAQLEKSETEVLYSRWRQSQPEDNVTAKRVKETKTRRRRMGSFRHLAVCREQHLMRAERTSLAKFQETVPRHYLPLLAKIPSFLRPEILVVTGESFRNECEVHTLIDETWLDSDVKTRLQVHDDPAVVLGDTVLFAWDDLECHRERRLQYVEASRNLSAEKGLQALVTLAIATLVVALTCGYLAGFVSTLLALPFVVGSLLLSQRALNDYARYYHREVGKDEQFQSSAGWLLLAAGLCGGVIAVSGLSWWLLAVCLLVGGLGATLLVGVLSRLRR